MAIPINDFWKRAVASRLLTPDRCRQLNDEFAALRGAEQSVDAVSLAEWLAASGVLTRGQVSALLAPRPNEQSAAQTSSQPTPQNAKGQRPPTSPSAKRRNPPPAPVPLAQVRSAQVKSSQVNPPPPLPEVHAPIEKNWEVPPTSFAARGRRSGGRMVSISALVSATVGLGLVAAIVVAGLVLSSRDQPKEKPGSIAIDAVNRVPRNEASEVTESASNSDTVSAEPVHVTPKSSAGEVDDDGKTLWMSPTAGQPVALDYLPSGAQLFLVVRLAEVLGNPEGAKVVDALGPPGKRVLNELRTTLGLEPTDVDQLIVAFYPDDMGLPQAAYVAIVRTPITEQALPKAWGAVERKPQNSKSFLLGARWAYYLPSERQGRVVAIAAPTAMKEILDLDGSPPLRKGIEKLLRHADAARHFNLLAAPGYLWTDGKTLLAGELERLRDPLSRTFNENIEAVLLSAHLGENLFLELRALGRVENQPAQLAQLLASRLAEAGEEVERYVASIEAHRHGRLVLNRLPRMVQLLCDYTRTGAEDRQAVLNCYLPLAAAHNLALGTQLALDESPAVATAVVVKSAAKGPQGAAAALEKRVTLSFPRDTLEHCLELLAKEIDVEIVILGSDLQLEGITKNQSFALDLRDRPAEEILREVLKLANSDGKLVYVIRSKNGQGEAIFVTTRAAAAKRGERLPDSFSAGSPEKP